MSDSPKRSIISIDNFWNILTWVAMPMSVYMSLEYGNNIFENGTIWGLISSFTMVPYILAKFNNIYFDPSSKEDTPLTEVKVFNKRGESLSMHLPFEFDYVKSCLIFVIIIMPLIINIFHPDRVTGNIVLFIFLGLPMSYFIKNNIPVSAFFNAKAWDYYEVLFTPNDKKVSHTPTSSDYSKNAPYYSPSYSSQLSNIYHRYHK
jgi:hypothetical protein